ncbi:MAG: bifunctional lysylphosphatidylglycerol flippase/synthetase MprF [Gemmatimonadaceae bacterium]|nr:bifunctional lysylphosphatidylglycerol flippase/synthetase MprF [Gemmatimonadaceae bacterium]
MTTTRPAPLEAFEPAPERRSRLARWLGPVAVFLIVALALHVLRSELGHYRYRDVVNALWQIPHRSLLTALGFSVLAYSILPAYDWLALRYIGRDLPMRRVAFGSVIAYGLSQTLGFPLFTGGAVRFRFWSAWGLSTAEITTAAGFAGTTFLLGVVAISGVVFLLEPTTTVALLRVPLFVVRGAGVLALLLVALYLLWSATRHAPIRIGSVELAVPGPATAVRQLAIAVADWGIAGAVLFALLPPDARPAYAPFLGVFLVAQFAGLISHVPGGLGVFDALMVVLLSPFLGAREVLGALVAYRLVYYFFPFAVAVLLLTAYEVQTRLPLRATADIAGRWVPAIVPDALGLATFVAGAVLLFSGATPSVRSRVTLLDAWLPLGLIEASHVAGSLTGAALLVVAWGIRRRLDVAYHLTLGLLALGALMSLLKGLDWEEALILCGVAAALLPAREAFYRRSRLMNEPFTPQWIIAVATVVGASIWLGVLSFRRTLFSTTVLLRFATHADAARFVRATAFVVAALAIYALFRLLRGARPEEAPQAPDDLGAVREIAAQSPSTHANLALLGDKRIILSESRRAFIMYGVAGRSWVALGDPVGPAAEHRELAWTFREEADRHDAWAVFYSVSSASLPLCIDLGLSLIKLGETAIVPLADFSLAGGGRKGLRRALKDVESEGGTFELHPASEVPALLPELRRVSDDWLTVKRTREKGFSIGYFDEEYLANFPVALVRVSGRIVAFANVWESGGREELSFDLMRHTTDAPSGVMDFLFIKLMLWGHENGFRRFDLGMAPLSGVERRELGPMWARAGAWVYRHGEHFYNFQGLRQYKDKFDPQWEPRYLASPGGLALPRVLAGVSILVSRGVRGVVTR